MDLEINILSEVSQTERKQRRTPFRKNRK